MWFVPSGPSSQVPRPPISATIATTAAVRARPPSATVAPSTTNGIVLPIRWPKPACRNGANAMSGSVSTSRGWIPLVSRSPPATSTISSAHITATIAPTRINPRRRSSGAGRLRCGSSAVAGMSPESLRPALRGTHAGGLDLEPRQHPLQPARDPPVAVAEQLHHGRHEHHPHERGVEEDRRREPDSEQLEEHVRG